MTTRVYLGTARNFKVKTGGTAIVTARRILGDQIAETSTLPVKSGELTVHARSDGRLVVDSLTLAFGDIQLSPKSFPPDGLLLKEIVVSAHNELPPRVAWTDDDSTAAASGDVRLLLDWSVVGVGGYVLPLATQTIDPVPLELDVAREHGGKLVATIHADRPGVFLAWTGYIELLDLTLDIEATSP